MPKSDQNHEVSFASHEQTKRVDEEAAELVHEHLFAQEQARQERATNPAGATLEWACRLPSCEGTLRAVLQSDTPNPSVYGPAGRSRGRYVAYYACDECGVMHARPPKDVVSE